MKIVSNSSDLIVGDLYWLKCKSTGRIDADICKQNIDSGVTFFKDNVWADNNNPQAFNRWHIVEVEVPYRLTAL